MLLVPLIPFLPPKQPRESWGWQKNVVVSWPRNHFSIQTMLHMLIRILGRSTTDSFIHNVTEILIQSSQHLECLGSQGPVTSICCISGATAFQRCTCNEGRPVRGNKNSRLKGNHHISSILIWILSHKLTFLKKRYTLQLMYTFNVVFLTKPSKITSKLMMCLTGDPP